MFNARLKKNKNEIQFHIECLYILRIVFIWTEVIKSLRLTPQLHLLCELQIHKDRKKHQNNKQHDQNSR